MNLLAALFCTCCNCCKASNSNSRVTTAVTRKVVRPLPDRLTFENEMFHKHYYDPRLSAYDGILHTQDLPKHPWTVTIISPGLKPIPSSITIRSRNSEERQYCTIQQTSVQNMYCIRKL